MQMKAVLIVEDNPDTRHIFATVLQHAGYTVLEAEDGERGVHCAQEHRPELILMDLMMPVMDGWGAVEQLKADKSTASIPVFAVSAQLHGNADAERACAAGFECCLSKPIAPKAIVKAVRDRIGSAETTSEPHRHLAPARGRGAAHPDQTVM